MIPVTSARCQRSAETDWQRELIEALGLPATLLGAAERASVSFRVRVPRAYVARMRYGDANDPLLRQVLPLGAELESVPGFASDPLDEASALVAPGLLHKYHGRALLITTGACAIHCRYCFRREFPYAEESGARHWRAALAHIAGDPGIEELILSGGDPLTLSDARLTALTHELAHLPHLRRLRVRLRAAARGPGNAAQSDGAAAGRQRRCDCPRGALRAPPRDRCAAVLPASHRSGARHGSFRGGGESAVAAALTGARFAGNVRDLARGARSTRC